MFLSPFYAPARLAVILERLKDEESPVDGLHQVAHVATARS